MVEHQPDQQRFIIEQDGNTCVLDYVRRGDTVNFTHTYVPFRLRGKGLAELLVEEALRWADGESLRKEASCWYVAKYLK